ncbi:hypothetical protein [Actinomadura atramentaria]|uniref:hypothetical protein n=1 Tax=Actinomadura atramentaria TaxID=1990 RepID=UPI00036B0818|nr:hypothetical protein [Actinomadura atramentaria]
MGCEANLFEYCDDRAQFEVYSREFAFGARIYCEHHKNEYARTGMALRIDPIRG